MHFQYASIDKINDIFSSNVPILIMHSQADDKLPFKHSVALYTHVMKTFYPTSNLSASDTCEAAPKTRREQSTGDMFGRCYFNEHTACIHHHDYTEEEIGRYHCNNDCPIRLVQVNHADHNSVHYTKLWSHHMYDFLEYVEGYTLHEVF